MRSNAGSARLHLYAFAQARRGSGRSHEKAAQLAAPSVEPFEAALR